MIRKLADGECRIYSRGADEKVGVLRHLTMVDGRQAAGRVGRGIRYCKRY